MKKVLLAITLFLCVALLFSCSGVADDISALKEQEIKLLYRESSVIAIGKCSLILSDGKTAQMSIEEIVAGYRVKLSNVYCEAETSFDVNERYLLFLRTPKEDTANTYATDGFEAMKINADSNIKWDDGIYALSDIKAHINKLDDIKQLPATTYFYEKRNEFIENCDAVVIGRIDTLLEDNMNVCTRTSTAYVERQEHGIKYEIRVSGCLLGDYENGDHIPILYTPNVLNSMTDATTLSTVVMEKSSVISLDNQNYFVFFLRKSPSSKQKLMFPINPVQGWAKLDGDNIAFSVSNTLFNGCKTLMDLVGLL